MFNNESLEREMSLVKEIENGKRFSLRKFLAVVELNAISSMR